MAISAPTEVEVRAALRWMLDSCATGSGQVVDEFWIPESNERVDIACLCTRFKAFEIKTHRDTLRRLPRQVNAYARIFEECTAVVAERHLNAVRESLPTWWGIIVILNDTDVKLDRVRIAGTNPSLDSHTMVRLLWKKEASSALRKLGEAPHPSASRTSLWELLLDRADTHELKSMVLEALISRQSEAPQRQMSLGVDCCTSDLFDDHLNMV